MEKIIGQCMLKADILLHNELVLQGHIRHRLLQGTNTDFEPQEMFCYSDAVPAKVQQKAYI